MGRSAVACRQLASRARRRVRTDDRRVPVDPAEHRRVAERFARAATGGDIDALIAELDPDAVGEFDSGGLVRGVPTSLVTGAERVASVLLASVEGLGVRFVPATVNGEPGVVAVLRDRVSAVLALDIGHDGVDHVRTVGNPLRMTRAVGGRTLTPIPSHGVTDTSPFVHVFLPGPLAEPDLDVTAV